MESRALLSGLAPEARRPRPAIQTKLEIGAPNDRFEQEAERVADRVMRMPDPSIGTSLAPVGIQRLCAECEEEVQRQPVDDEEEVRMKRASGATPEIAPGLQTRISGLCSGGQPLSPALRGFFEPRFGHDFSQVHLHHGSQAGEAARALGARAYTLGQDVVFGQGQYRPESNQGRRLIAHELTHVIQQAGASRPFVQRQGPGALSTTEGQLPPPQSIAGPCPVAAEGTLSEVSWGESRGIYPTKNMTPTEQEMYHPENWDEAKKCELLKARRAMHTVGQRNKEVHKLTPNLNDPIEARMERYHFIENFPALDPEIADTEVEWFLHAPKSVAVHAGVQRGDPERQVCVKTYGPFYNNFEGQVPKGPVYILF
jgi:hypothetical protein